MTIKIKTDYVDFEFTTPETCIYPSDITELNKILDKVFSAAPKKAINPNAAPNLEITSKFYKESQKPTMTAEEFFDPKNFKPNTPISDKK